jgi:HAD superfamily hydrolase (TIGR01509 family)
MTGNRSAGRLEAAIFDLDGTLVDSEPLHARCVEEFLDGYGLSIDSNAYVGRGVKDMLLDLERRFPDSPLSAIALDRRIALLADRTIAAAADLRAFPAVVSLAAELGRRGLILAVASGSSPGFVAAALARTGREDLFDAVLSSVDVKHGKPAPDIFVKTARRLGVPPERCVVFEDSRFGVLAAKRAGMLCVALPPRADGLHHEDYGMADILIESGPEALDGEALLAELETRGLPIPGLPAGRTPCGVSDGDADSRDDPDYEID